MTTSTIIAILVFVFIIGFTFITSFYQRSQSAKRNKRRLDSYERLTRSSNARGESAAEQNGKREDSGRDSLFIPGTHNPVI